MEKLWQGTITNWLITTKHKLIDLDDSSIRAKVKEDIAATKKKYPEYAPHLAVIQVGGREDSSIYVKMKHKAALEVNNAGSVQEEVLFPTRLCRLVSNSLMRHYPSPFLKPNCYVMSSVLTTIQRSTAYLFKCLYLLILTMLPLLLPLTTVRT